MKSHDIRHGLPALLFHLAFAVFAFMYLFPFLWMLFGAFKSQSEFLSPALSLLPQQWVWGNFAQAWYQARFETYFRNTVFVTVTTTAIVIALTSMAGYALAKGSFPGKKAVIGLVLLSMFLPRGYTIVPIFELVQSLGLLNTLWAVILVSVASSMVFNTFLFLAYFRTVPDDLLEAAAVDGASFPRVYWQIALPLAKPMIAAVALLEFIGTWNDFFIPLVFTLSRPELRTVAVGMYAFVGEHSTEWPLMCAAATISLLPTIMLFFVLQRLFIRGMAGAIRG